ncbi:LamG-like jellyroll fold domain-containing protein [Paenibacillus sp. HJGM_3]|uniref:LamG-like jellyroll fold domain-containing protein n=1 Tax=Paenibacillus sp. HJGM_3 TaxID=3379816 RepID=UPI00385EEF4B
MRLRNRYIAFDRGLRQLNGTSTVPFSIGSHIGTYEFFKGRLDDIRVYNIPLTASQISQVMAGN